MANLILRRKVLTLRKLGRSYSQIRNELGVSKSTLSGWLRNYPLSKEQIHSLQHNEAKIEKYRQTMKLKRETRLQKYYKEARTTLFPLTKKELFLAGLFLYWGEGGKTEKGMVSISNTDPSVLKFSLLWMIKALEVPKDKVYVILHLYEDMDREEAVTYWSSTLNIPKTQFVKPYLKKSKRSDVDYKGFGHGTCMLRVFNTDLKTKVLMSIKAMGEYSDEYILAL